MSSRWVLYVDGSGTARPEAGGCAYAAYSGHAREPQMTGSLPLAHATNQQAELLAAAYGLHSLPPSSLVLLYSDSEYVVRGWNEYLPVWLQQDWRRLRGGQVANVRHWQRLQVAVARHDEVVFEWCRGHAGVPENELVDKLAGMARQQALAAAL